MFQVGGTTTLYGVACGSDSECVAVGWVDAGNPSAVVVTFVDGEPGSVQGVGPGQLRGVSCGTATDCLAVGGDYNSFAETVPIHAGEAGAASSVGGSGMLYGAACTSATDCVLTGECLQSGVCSGTIVAHGAVQSIPASVVMYRVSCFTAVDCLAVGNHGPGPDHAGVLVNISKGAAGGAVTVPGLQALEDVSCMTATSCLAVGEDYPPSHGVLVPIVSGTPGGPQALSNVFPHAISCPTEHVCVVAGREGNPADGVIVVLTDGVPTAREAAPDVGQFEDITCPADDLCVAVGSDPHAGTGVIAEIDLTGASTAPPTSSTPGDLLTELLDLVPWPILVLAILAVLLGLLLVVRRVYGTPPPPDPGA